MKLILLFLILACSTHSDSPVTTVELGKIYNIQLETNEKFQFEIQIPSKITGKPNLYISAYSPINDPSQQPTLSIVSNDYQLTCDSQSSNLNSVCFIPSSMVSTGKKFKVDTTCQIYCKAKLVAYLSDTLELDLNEQVKITTKNSPIEKMIQIFIPSNYDFTEIQLMMSVKNKIQVTTAVQMYINCGKSGSVSYPSKSSHQQIKIVSWGQNKAAILKKGVQINQQEKIYILIKVGTNTTLTFQSRVVSNGTRYLQLNQYYYDCLELQSRLYVLDLTDIDFSSLTSIYIQLTQFSGSPSIQVAFDKLFQNKKVSQSKTVNVRFEITPEMIQSNSFTKVIYVKISSYWPATYSLYSRFKDSDSDSIRVGVAQYIEIRPNEIGVLVHDRNENFQTFEQNKSIQVKIENEGPIESNAHIFTCKQMSILNCKVNKNIGLNSLPTNFNQLPIQTGKQIIKANYSNKNCVATNTSIDSNYFCIMVIVLVPKNTQETGKYSITILEQEFIIPLSEGKSKLSEVKKQQYAYFSFYLPQKPPIVIQVFFFVNTLDGVTKIFASIQLPKPKIDNNISNTTIKVGSENISFKGSQIKVGMYYLTVYGYQYSDFVVNVIVRRLDPKKIMQFLFPQGQSFFSKTQISEIQLSDSIAQVFVLEIGKDHMTFIFKSIGIGKIYLKVTQIIGKITTYITLKATHSRILCQQNQCQINGQRWESYLVEVIGDVSKLQRFSIIFKQIKQCYTFPIGVPFYINLDKNDMQCLEYKIDPSSPFQISSSLTNLQMLNEVVEIIILFQNNHSVVMTANTYLFQNSQLSNYCQSDVCKITVQYISFDQEVQFETIAQKIDGVITLYDGVVQKIDINLTSDTVLHYRYPLDVDQSIQIFVTSQTYCDFSIHAALIEGSLSQLIKYYPTSSTSSNETFKVSSSIDSPTMTMLPINKAKLKKIITNFQLQSPYLAISMYGISTENQQCTYSIEVTQRERILREGDLQIGFLQPNQVVSYELYPSQMSLLQIRPLYKDKCYKFFDDKNQQLKDSVFIQNPKTIPMYYHIRGIMLWSCMYQISLQNFQDSILNVVQGFPIKVVSQYNEVSYFLYKHITNSSFKIYEFIEAGSSRVYATPISAHQLNNGLKNIANELSLSSFKYRDDLINNLNIQAKQNTTDYCFDCYYLIAIRGNPSVQEQIVVARQETPITIKEHSLLDSYLDKNQSESFIYYSNFNTDWTLNVDVVYGSVNVTIKNMNKGILNNVVKNKIVTNELGNIVIPFNNSNFINNNPTDSLDQQRKYKIEIVAIKQALYHLQILKYSGSYRIAQGIASKVMMPTLGKVYLQFDHNLDNGVIDVNLQATIFSVLHINATVYYSPDAFLLGKRQLIIFDMTTIGNVITLSFDGKKGHYMISLVSLMLISFDFIVLMPRPGLSELRVGKPTISKTEAIFQLYTEEGNYAILQVFPCQGNMKIRGADNLGILERGQISKNQVQLLHQNLGGHFIVSTPQNVSGQYFIRVQNKEYEANMRSQVSGIAYMIQYRTFSNGELNPYEYLDADNYQIKIDQSSQNENLILQFENVQSLNKNIQVKLIRYTFIIGFSSDDVRNYLFCESQNTKRLTFSSEANTSNKKYQMKISKKQVLKNGGILNDAYIGVTALISAENKNGNKYDDLTFIYQPGYLGKLKTTPMITDFGLFQVMVIVFLIIGGTVILFAMISYLVKVCRGYSKTNELIQQQSNQNKNQNNVMKSSQFEISNQIESKQNVQEVIQ